MNIQEIYDKAVNGLVAQKFIRSIKGYGSEFCMYRNHEGLKCAIGHCIPDDVYDQKFEGMGRSEVFDKVFDVQDATYDYDILLALQACHDNEYTPIDMAQHLKQFGVIHNLIIPDTLLNAIKELEK